MTIETEFSINEMVWVMRKDMDNCPYQLKVKQVQVTVDYWWNRMNSNKQKESYFLTNGITAFCHNEWYGGDKVFSTKEELLKSL